MVATSKTSSKIRKSELDEALEVLTKAKLKRTHARVAMLEYLIREHGPFSTDEIFAALKRKDLDRVTAYRCLTSFEKIGLVRRCDFGDGIARYEIQLAPEKHHHHIICVECRKTENLESCKLPTFDAQVKQLGYSQIKHSLEFFGICPDCNQVA